MTDRDAGLEPEEAYDRTFVEREDLKKTFSLEVDDYVEIVSHSTVKGEQTSTITFQVVEDEAGSGKSSRRRRAYLVCDDGLADERRSHVRKGEPTAVLYFPRAYAEDLRVHLDEREERPVHVHVREYKGGHVWATVER